MKTRTFLAITIFGAASALFAQTTAQTDAGRASYQAKCSGCHAADLGGGEGPELACTNFQASWVTRNASELISFIQKSMPPGMANLGDAEAANLAGFILA